MGGLKRGPLPVPELGGQPGALRAPERFGASRESLARSLRRCRAEDSLAPEADRVVAWLSGSSSAASTRPSPAQGELLLEVAAEGYVAVPAGFPWNAAVLGEPWVDPPLVAASLRNARQLLACLLVEGFRADVARAVAPLLARTRRRLVLVCGSCGIELLRAALARTQIPGGLDVLAIALGPVGRAPAPHPRLRLVVVRGRRDRWSRWGARLPTEVETGGGHLSYAADPEVRRAVRRLVREHAAG